MIIENKSHLADIAFSAVYGGLQSHFDSGSCLKSLDRIRCNIHPAQWTFTWSLANMRARGVPEYENLKSAFGVVKHNSTQNSIFIGITRRGIWTLAEMLSISITFIYIYTLVVVIYYYYYENLDLIPKHSRSSS